MRSGVVQNAHYIIAGLFLLVAVTAFFPQITVGTGDAVHHISMGELWQSIGKLDSEEAIPLVGGAAAGIKSLVRFFLVTWILMVLLPVIEAILALALRRGGFLLSSSLGIVVNTTLKIIAAGRIQSLSGLGDNISSLLFGVESDFYRMNPATMTIWILLHVIIAALIVWYLVRERMENTRRGIFREEQGLLIDEPFMKGREIVAERAFYGAITGLTGVYKGKGYPMLLGETVSIGSTEGDEIRVEGEHGASICQISYDEEMQEYHVQPTQSGCVFLKSGQPLGKFRKYCLPRGTEIMIVDGGNRFTLA